MASGAFKKNPQNLFNEPASDLLQQSDNLFQHILGGIGKFASFIGRPASAVAGFSKGLLVDEDIGKAFSFAKKGITGEKVYQFSDILKRLGIGEMSTGVDLPFIGELTGRGTLGLALDIATDPLTYISLVGLTKSAFSKAGIKKPKLFSEGAQKIMNDYMTKFHIDYGTAKQAAINNVSKEVDDLRRGVSSLSDKGTQFADLRDPLRNPFFAMEKGPPPVGITKEVRDSSGELLTRFGAMNDEYKLADMKQKGINALNEAWDERVLPGFKKRWKSENLDKLEAELAGVETGKHVNAAKLLDNITETNQTFLQVLRNAEAESMGILGGTLTDQAAKGFRSLVTFAGRSPAEIAKGLGLPEFTVKRLRQIDALVLKGVDAAIDKFRNTKVGQQIQQLFNTGTGVSSLDRLIVSLKGKNEFERQEALKRAFKVQADRNDYLKYLPPDKHGKFYEQVGNFLESTNLKNTLKISTDESHEWLPGVVEFGTKIRKIYDEQFQKLVSSGADFGIEMRYLDGYIRRELRPEIKEMMYEISNEVDAPSNIFKGYNSPRDIKWQRLSTEEINKLFRENRLGFQFFEKRLKDPKYLKRIQKIDPEFASYFIEDPAQAVANYIIRSEKIVSQRDAVKSLIKNFARPIFSPDSWRASNEAIVAPIEYFKVGGFKELGIREQTRVIRELVMDKSLSPKQAKAIIDSMTNLDSKEMLEAAVKGETSKYLPQRLFSELSFNNAHMLGVLHNVKAPLYVADKEVVKAINEFMQFSKSPDTHNTFLKAWDGLTDLWKRTTLAPFISFHFRNALSDVWNSFYEGVNPLKELGPNGAHVHAFEILKDAGFLGLHANPITRANGVERITGDILLKDGSKLSRKTALQWFLQDGGSAGIIRDLPITLETTLDDIEEYFKSWWKTKGRANPLSKNFAPVALGNKGAEIVSMQNRFAHYISKLKDGYLRDEAMMSMKKSLFDYNNLSTFEKNVLRRIFPFYTWMRKNIPLQVEMMIKQPGKFANLMKAVNAIGDEKLRDEIPEEGIPDYIKNEFGIPTKRVGNNVYEFLLLGNYTPVADLIKVGSKEDIIRLGAKSLNPMIQTVLEGSKVFPNNFYSGLPVERYPGEKGEFLGNVMDKKTINALRKIRILNSVDKFFLKEDPNNPYQKKQYSPAEIATAAVTGLNPRRIDVQKIIEMNDRKAGEIGTKLKSAYKKAVKMGDKDMIDYLDNLLQDQKK